MKNNYDVIQLAKQLEAEDVEKRGWRSRAVWAYYLNKAEELIENNKALYDIK